MGAWGLGVFEDDTALDQLDDFLSFDDPKEFMREAFQYALETDYLEFDEGISVLVCAALLDACCNQIQYEVLEEEDYEALMVTLKEANLNELRPLASKALDVVLSINSEIHELWEENEQVYPKWKANLIQLKGRLN
jgi:Domain of unknown function (DUF4259)